MIPKVKTRLAAFLQGLQQLGWADGRNVRIDIRWAGAKADDIRKHAAELAELAPDVILAHGTSTVRPLIQATRTVPIVFVNVIDPVGAALVDSLARPGGNATGFIQFEYGISAKWLELLKEIAPGVRRVAVLRDAANSGTGQFGALQSVAPSMGVRADPDQRARRERDRAHHYGLCALSEWRTDRNGELACGSPSSANHHACGASTSCPRSTPPAFSSKPAA